MSHTTAERLAVLTPGFRRILVNAYLADAERLVDELAWGVSSRDVRLVVHAARELARISRCAAMTEVSDICGLLVEMAHQQLWGEARIAVAQIQVAVADLALDAIQRRPDERAKA
jgi:hypothetical protein